MIIVIVLLILHIFDSNSSGKNLLQHSLADVKRSIVEYCLLPLGSELIHKNLPTPIKTVLLYGSSGSGKSMLSHCIANECRCCLYGSYSF